MRKEEGQSGDAAFSVLTFLFPPSSRHPALLEALVSGPAVAHPDASASSSPGGYLDAKASFSRSAVARCPRISRAEQPSHQQRLHVTPAVRDQIDDDPRAMYRRGASFSPEGSLDAKASFPQAAQRDRPRASTGTGRPRRQICFLKLGGAAEIRRRTKSRVP
jgi:hypothetical protein